MGWLGESLGDQDRKRIGSENTRPGLRKRRQAPGFLAFYSNAGLEPPLLIEAPALNLVPRLQALTSKDMRPRFRGADASR
jgi:hypothetical protein